MMSKARPESANRFRSNLLALLASRNWGSRREAAQAIGVKLKWLERVCSEGLVRCIDDGPKSNLAYLQALVRAFQLRSVESLWQPGLAVRPSQASEAALWEEFEAAVDVLRAMVVQTPRARATRRILDAITRASVTAAGEALKEHHRQQKRAKKRRISLQEVPPQAQPAAADPLLVRRLFDAIKELDEECYGDPEMRTLAAKALAKYQSQDYRTLAALIVQQWKAEVGMGQYVEAEEEKAEDEQYRFEPDGWRDD